MSTSSKVVTRLRGIHNSWQRVSTVLGLVTPFCVTLGKALPFLGLGFSWLVCANTLGADSLVPVGLAVQLLRVARVQHQAGSALSDGTVFLSAL